MKTASTDIAMHPKFIDPVTDFGFKLIFKDEEITRGFLNALVKTQYPEINIASVTIADGELDDTSKTARRVIYDVRCVTDKGEEFVIEMQNGSQEFFSERIVHYLSRAASRQQSKGYIDYAASPRKSKKKKQKLKWKPQQKVVKRDWNYRMKNIYGVFFMNFRDARHPKKIAHIALQDSEEHYTDTEVFQYWKIQMPFYREMKEYDCKTDIDKWIFNLTNMPDMSTKLAFTNDIPLFMRLEKIASYSALTPKQQIQYDDSFNNYLAVLGHQEYYTKEGYKKGIEEGMEKGMEQGRAEEKISTARKMKLKGYSLEDIAEMTGLTLSEINDL